jgi:hypothetical protein
MKKFTLLFCLLFICTGCVGEKAFWRPDTIYTEHGTYDGDQLYNEVGVSGELGNSGVRMDLFGAAYTDMHGGRDHQAGGGVRFEIPLGGK